MKTIVLLDDIFLKSGGIIILFTLKPYFLRY